MLPGLAVFPRLCLSPRTCFAIPLLSVGLIYILVSLLQWLNLYHTQSAVVISLMFLILSLYHLIKTIPKATFEWEKCDKFVWFFILCLMMPYFIKLGTEAFERGDEIYSWNYWALQHLYGEPLDFFHTGATYPQLFPKIISYCYLLLGDIQLQCPTKAMLGMFPLCMLGAWASVLAPFNYKRVALFLFGALYVVAGLKLEQFFNDGYADPVMTSALVVSMALAFQATILYRSEQEQISQFKLLALSVFIGFVACATKQPAFMWCSLILPLYIFIEGIKHQEKYWFFLALASIGLAALWLATEGGQFYKNEGVIFLSFEGRGYVQQFIHVFHRYLIKTPLLLVFFIVTAFLVKSRQTRFIYYAFVLPQTFLWLMFGAYQLRLGQHVISVGALLCFLSVRDSQYSFGHPMLSQWLKENHKKCATIFASLSLVACIGLLIKIELKDKPGLDYKQGGRVSLERYFKADAQKVYDEIYLNKDALLWVPSRYIYGIFYKHTKLTTPDYALYHDYNQAALVSEFRKKLPDYVFTVSEEIIDGPASKALSQVVENCPNSFSVFASPPNKFNYTTYQVDKIILAHDPCLSNLIANKG